MSAVQSLPPLSLRRLHPGEKAPEGLAPLGGLSFGMSVDEAGALDAVDLPMLAGDGPVLDAWCGAGHSHPGRSGRVRWHHDGHWLWGAVEVGDDDGIAGLEAQAYHAYADLFRALRESGITHLQRLWNYLPRINADGGGLERYRQFNTGRQRAFLQARQAAFEGAPAACAIGTRGGPLCVRFLAGRHAPVPVENPRQVSAYHYPKTYGPTSPTFSRAALIDAGDDRVGLLISGTASIVGHETRHVGDVAEQSRETLRNLEAVIAAAQTKTSARFALSDLECVIYVRRPEDTADIRALFEATVGADSVAARTAIYAEADICRADLLVEIEAHAFAPGEVRR